MSGVDLAGEQDTGTGSTGPATGRFPYVLAVLLAVASFWPMRAALDWIAGNIPTAQHLRDIDGIGETIFPILAMFARPVLAALGSLASLYFSALVFTSPVDRAFGILTKAGLVQGAVALATYVTGPPANAALGWMLRLFEDLPNVDTIVSADVIARQEAAAADVLPALIGIAFAYLLAAALSEYAGRRSAASEQVAAVAAGDFTSAETSSARRPRLPRRLRSSTGDRGRAIPRGRGQNPE